MDIITIANKLLAVGTFLAQIFILLTIIYYAFFREKYPLVGKFIGKNGLFLMFVVALASTLGSLFYSNIAGFRPCELCWFQRIFMYPLVLFGFLALLKKDFKIVEYLLPFSVIGFLISLYQNYMYYYNNGLDASCVLGGSQVSCIKRYVLELGYISIPIMALTAFVLVVVFLLFQREYNKNKFL